MMRTVPIAIATLLLTVGRLGRETKDGGQDRRFIEPRLELELDLAGKVTTDGGVQPLKSPNMPQLVVRGSSKQQGGCKRSRDLETGRSG